MRVLRISSYFAVSEPGCPHPSPWHLTRKFRTIGGQQIQVRLLTSTLSALGVRQEIITTRPPWCPAVEDWNGVRIYRHGLPVGVRHQLYQLPALVRAVQRVSDGFDLVHVHSGEDVSVIPIGLAAARLGGIPLVITLHNSWNLTYRRITAGPWRRIREELGGRAEIAGIRNASALCVLTDRTARLLTGRFGVPPDQVFVVPDGVDLRRFADPPGDAQIADFARRHGLPAGFVSPVPVPRDRGWPADPCLLFLGRLVPQKGVTHLLHAAALLAGRGHQFRLLICGDGRERERLEGEVRALGLSGRTAFTGFVSYRDVPLALAVADLAVMPSVYEEFGSVLLEVMASGTPVVATRAGGIPAVIEHGRNGVLVPPGRADQLASALAALLANSRLARTLAHRAQVTAADHDCLSAGRKMLDVYAGCVRHRARRHDGVRAA